MNCKDCFFYVDASEVWETPACRKKLDFVWENTKICRHFSNINRKDKKMGKTRLEQLCVTIPKEQKDYLLKTVGQKDVSVSKYIRQLIAIDIRNNIKEEN